MRVCPYIAVSAVIGAASVPGLAGAESSVLSIAGYARTVCNVQFGAVAILDQQAILRWSELCNDTSGYRVYVSASAASDVELVLDNVPVRISANQELLVVDSDGPAALTRSAAFHFASDGAPPVIRVRVEAKRGA